MRAKISFHCKLIHCIKYFIYVYLFDIYENIEGVKKTLAYS